MYQRLIDKCCLLY